MSSNAKNVEQNDKIEALDRYQPGTGSDEDEDAPNSTAKNGWKFRAAEQFLCFWHEYRNGLLYGWYLCRLFQLNELFLTEPQKARIYHYYVPVFLWCEQQITEQQSKFKDGEDIPPLVDVSSKAIINRAELSSNYRTSSGSDMTLSSSDDSS
ncbi:uncharacterized protein LOC114398782 [Glycine soja]|uniref:uncharacterized protein LOC114398782 n=1 Tax=Glycine soja TaxID=3848 RepID=UPI001038C3C3|nr:uncharacterized protein LOC114398782 [Glycine soja]